MLLTYLLVFGTHSLEREAGEEPLVLARVVTLLKDSSNLVGSLELLGLIGNSLRGHNLGGIEALEGVTARKKS